MQNIYLLRAKRKIFEQQFVEKYFRASPAKVIWKNGTIMTNVYSNNLRQKMCLQSKILRILTGKKHPEIKLQRLRKLRILTFGSLVHQINSFQEVLKMEQIFQKN